MAKPAPFKARLWTSRIGHVFVLVYMSGRWRVFAVPYSPKDDHIKPYKTNTQARKGAEKSAAALGITLKWEDK